MESKNLIHAYSLGCLGKENFDEMVSIIDKKELFEYQELGEYQNLAALLPAILNMEMPSSEVKDKVAMKLYSLQEELKKKTAIETPEKLLAQHQKINRQSAAEVLKTLAPESDEDDITSIFDNIPKNEIKQISDDEIATIEREFQFVPSPVTKPELINIPEQTKENQDNLHRNTIQDSDDTEFEVVSPNQPDAELVPPPQQTETKGHVIPDLSKEKTFEDIPQASIPAYELDKLMEQDPELKLSRDKYKPKYTAEARKRRSSGGVVLFILFLFLLIAASAAAYLKYTGVVKGYENKIKELNSEVVSLQTQLSNEETMKSIMDSQGIFVAELSSADFNSKAEAKVFLSGEKGEALFRLSGLPVLTGEGVYKIWINPGNKLEYVVSFDAEGSPFMLTATLSKEWIKSGAEIRITEEIKTEAGRQGEKVVLQGTVR
ncbi:MAG: anti-sigma factor [Ignavibacteriaceae bacterium]|nr:anti-sigma factor [Ignavibacteriaceae bacterium]